MSGTGILRIIYRHPKSIRCGYHESYRHLASFKPFNLANELTIDVKKSIEAKWSDRVYGVECPAELHKPKPVTSTSGQRKKSYILSMFPYPSGKLHLGHVRVYTLSDVLARYHRLRGEEVIHPMGWDAFGLPAENAARDHGVEPEKWTRENIKYMKEQIIRMGCSFDWQREFATCDPDYYKWTQWLFLKLWENGLAYKKRAYVFWDPIDQTVLAEEQVDSEMRSWRSGAIVEKKLLHQWFIRTAVFAKNLMDCLNSNELKHGWRDVIDLQKHWIGPIHGYFGDCRVFCERGVKPPEATLRVWFSTPDSLKKSKFVLLQPNHYLSNSEEYILKRFQNGVKQLNFFVLNPYVGLTMPVFTVPESSEIPFPLIPESADGRVDEVLNESVFKDLAANEAFMETLKPLYPQAAKNNEYPDVDHWNFQFHPASLKLRDWLVSRQRSWGTPIPAITCSDCGHSSVVPLEGLPVLNKPAIEYAVCHNTNPMKCTKCGSANTKPETDTLDTFFDSAWYYLRFLDPKQQEAIFAPTVVEDWLPVRTYIGGKEHATLHLYYARFMSHFLHQQGYVPHKEPFKVLVPIGVVMGETFVNKNGKYILSKDTELNEKKKLVERGTGLSVVKKWEKMSKSKHNGIDPDQMLDEYGIDALRLLSMADVAPTSARKWNALNFNGFLKFQNKVWHAVQDFVSVKEVERDTVPAIDEEVWQKTEDDLFDSRNYHLKGVTFNYEDTSQISVAITKLQGMVAALRRIPKSSQRDSIQFERTLGTLLICLYPIMPAYCAQLWQYFREVAELCGSEFDLDKEVWCQAWPEVDQNYRLDLILQLSHHEYSITKVERQILDTMDVALAMELAFDNEELTKIVPVESAKVISYVVQPSYRAILNIADPKYQKKSTKANLEKSIEQV